MKKSKILKTLSILTLLAFCAGRSYADGTQITQTLSATIQPSVSVTKSAASVETGEIDPENGSHAGIVSVFNISTNGNDSNYDFFLSATFPNAASMISAYDGSGNIMFGNVAYPPTELAIQDAIIHGTYNKNVISYPVTVTAESPMTVTTYTHPNYSNCYRLKLNSSQEGSLTHTVGTTPVTNTYILSQDAAGTYQATITLTAVAK